jgi:hypothetical protein
MSTDLPEKEKYETPVLTRIGSFEDITQGGSPGHHVDVSFPIGTPVSQLAIFS